MSFFDKIRNIADSAKDRVYSTDISTKAELIAAGLCGIGAVALTVAANQMEDEYLIEGNDILELDPSEVEIQTVDEQGE